MDLGCKKMELNKYSYATAAEIQQQPEIWRKIYQFILDNRKSIVGFLQPLLKRNDLKIILTGAGTSAFIGDNSEGYLRRKLRLDVNSIATTDIVTSPEDFFLRDKPTLIISHARSGDSPESIAAIEIAQKIIKEVYFINITCNKDGKMAKTTSKMTNCLNLILPEGTNDRGFAMTSSFTGMLLTDLMLPNLDVIEQKYKLIDKLAHEGERILYEDADIIRDISKLNYDRLVYLGSGSLSGCAKEAALKSLELTQGQVNAISNTSLGFRHGPKSVINDTTLLGFFVSNNPYTAKYDIDLIREIAGEPGERKLMVFLPAEGLSFDVGDIDYVFRLKGDFKKKDTSFLALLYIMYAQMLGFFKSLAIGITPDNPNPEGRVNRVVRGVNIYDYK